MIEANIYFLFSFKIDLFHDDQNIFIGCLGWWWWWCYNPFLPLKVVTSNEIFPNLYVLGTGGCNWRGWGWTEMGVCPYFCPLQPGLKVHVVSRPGYTSGFRSGTVEQLTTNSPGPLSVIGLLGALLPCVYVLFNWHDVHDRTYRATLFFSFG